MSDAAMSDAALSEPAHGALASRSASTREVDDFLDVVLADPDLLAAEFDAIIEGAWSGSRATPSPSTRRPVAQDPRPPSPQKRSAAPAPGPPRRPGPRVRSPPQV